MMLACPACGVAVSPDDKFCRNCGASTEQPVVASVCQECGQQFDRPMRFCTNCGSPIKATAPTPVPERPPVETAVPTVSPPRPAVSTGERGWERVLGRVTAPVFRGLSRLPFYSRLAPYLGLNQLARLHSLVVLASLVVPALLGFYSSQYGHIDTTPWLFQVMPIISYISPMLGLLGGVVFGIADMAEKMVTNNIYGATGFGNYVGARVGYLISYSSVIVLGVLPGLLARVFRLTARRIMAASATRSTDGGEFVGTFTQQAIETAASIVGLMAGAGIAPLIAIPLELPAFYFRPNPDYSCYSAAVNNLRNVTRSAAATAGIGGVLWDVARRILWRGPLPPAKPTAPARGPTPTPAPATPSPTAAPTTPAPTATPAPAATPSPAPTPWHAKVPKEDRIYDNFGKRGPYNQTASDFLKDLSIYDDLKNLDPRDPDFWENLDKLIDKSKDGRKIEAITFDRIGDRHGPIDEDSIVVVIREPARPPTVMPPTLKPPTPKPPTAKPPTPKPPTPTPATGKPFWVTTKPPTTTKPTFKPPSIPPIGPDDLLLELWKKLIEKLTGRKPPPMPNEVQFWWDVLKTAGDGYYYVREHGRLVRKAVTDQWPKTLAEEARERLQRIRNVLLEESTNAADNYVYREQQGDWGRIQDTFMEQGNYDDPQGVSYDERQRRFVEFRRFMDTRYDGRTPKSIPENLLRRLPKPMQEYIHRNIDYTKADRVR